MLTTTRAWRGEDDPGRFERAVVHVDDRGMTAHGTSITETYALAWRLDATDDWRTRSLGVSVRGDGWGRSLELTRASTGRWTAAAATDGRSDGPDPDLPDPGLDDPATVDDAVDVDLGLCPVTNTMPIRRLGLLEGRVPSRRLAVAWVEVPSLRVVRSEQVYGSVGTGLIAFSSGDFAAEITVDPQGIVIDYPELARRVDGS